MANLPNIEICFNLRPCLVGCDDDAEKALFHCWSNRAYIIEPSMLVGGCPGGQVWNTYGIVELEDGSVVEVPPGNIRFLDNPLEELAWPNIMDSK